VKSILAVPDPQVLVLAAGDSIGAQNQAKGNLFEQFIGRLFAAYGYEEPTRERFNVSENGLELDLVIRHKLSGEPAVIECKAYSNPVRAHLVSSFFGRYVAKQRRESALRGYFVALPRLVPDGAEFARSVEDDDRFTVMIAHDVLAAMAGREIIPILDVGNTEVSDPAVIITEHGIYSCAYEIDASTRKAIRVLMAGTSGPASLPALELIRASSYADGLAVHDMNGTPAESSVAPKGLVELKHEPEPMLVAVRGGSRTLNTNFRLLLDSSSGRSGQ
jgi:hypothetical protein